MMYGRGEWRYVTEPFGRTVAACAPHTEIEPPTFDANGNDRRSFPHLLEIEKRIRNGETLEPVIAAAPSPDDPYVLVEGWKRATAYVRVLPPEAEVAAFVGYSPAMVTWRYYR